jgi:transposase
VAAVANKRPKKAATPTAPTPTPPAEEDRKRKTPLPFQRKVAVEGHLRCFKVRMLPTPEQTRELKRAFSASRRAFNWALDRVRNHGERPNNIALRNAYRKEPPPPWAAGKQAVASRIVAGGVKQLADAYASNHAKRKKDPSHAFEIKFRSTRRCPSEALKIDKDTANDKQSPLNRFAPMAHPYPKRFAEQRRHGRAECLAFLGNNFGGVGGIVLQDKPRVIERMLAEGGRLKEDGKILWDRRTGHFQFVYTFEQPRLADPDPTFASKRVVAMDPGVRVFQTWYAPTSGAHGELNAGFQQQIEPRIHALDALQSRVDRRYDTVFEGKRVVSKTLKAPPRNRTKKQYHATTRALKRKLARDRRRHVGWVESAHYEAANFVLKDHDVVIQPWLHSARLTQKSERVIRSKVARSMLTMSHYKYRQRLQWASTRYAGRHVLVTEEPGTSKTCTLCGHWHAGLGSSETFECPKCDLRIGRDLNGAIGNFYAAYGEAVGIGWDRCSG